MIALWEADDELMGVCPFCGLFDLDLRRIEFAESNILEDCVVEKEGILAHNSELIPPALQIVSFQIDVVDVNAP